MVYAMQFSFSPVADFPYKSEYFEWLKKNGDPKTMPKEFYMSPFFYSVWVTSNGLPKKEIVRHHYPGAETNFSDFGELYSIADAKLEDETLFLLVADSRQTGKGSWVRFECNWFSNVLSSTHPISNISGVQGLSHPVFVRKTCVGVFTNQSANNALALNLIGTRDKETNSFVFETNQWVVQNFKGLIEPWILQVAPFTNRPHQLRKTGIPRFRSGIK
jgi:hypothetical protein